MSALDDIRAALKRCPPPQRGYERAILIGESALGSIIAVAKIERDDDAPIVIVMIDGVPVRRTDEFKGWEIRDCDRRGKWHDVEPE